MPSPESAALVSAVEQFKTEMLLLERGIDCSQWDESRVQGRVSAACTALVAALQHHVRQDEHLERDVGAYVFRETSAFLMQSAVVDRSVRKPRGYAGDYYTIELVYQDTAQGSGRLGRYVDRWALDIPAARAVRNRRLLMTSTIREVAARANWSGPVLVTSLASGPARELLDLFGQPDQPDLRAICVDIDREALAYTSEIAHRLGASHQITFARDNVVRLAWGCGKTVVPPQHLIYTVGLIDYLEDGHVVRILDWIYDHLLPGGTAVVGNFDRSNPDKPYMDHMLQWQLIHRSAADLRDLFARSKFANAPVEVRREEAGVQLFAFCERPVEASPSSPKPRNRSRRG